MDRNTLLAIVLSMGVLLLWQIFVLSPEQERIKAAREAAAEGFAAVCLQS